MATTATKVTTIICIIAMTTGCGTIREKCAAGCSAIRLKLSSSTVDNAPEISRWASSLNTDKLNMARYLLELDEPGGSARIQTLSDAKSDVALARNLQARHADIAIPSWTAFTEADRDEHGEIDALIRGKGGDAKAAIATVRGLRAIAIAMNAVRDACANDAPSQYPEDTFSDLLQKMCESRYSILPTYQGRAQTNPTTPFVSKNETAAWLATKQFLFDFRNSAEGDSVLKQQFAEISATDVHGIVAVASGNARIPIKQLMLNTPCFQSLDELLKVIASELSTP